MRIAYVIIDCNRREGTARAVVEVAERMARTYGHEVHLYSQTADEVDFNLVTWHRVPALRRPHVANFVSFFGLATRVLSNASFDIIHSAGCNTSAAHIYTIQNVQAAKRKILARVARNERISLPRRFTRWLYLVITSAAEKKVYGARANGCATFLLPVSKGTERELREHYNVERNPIRIIPNAADTTIFHPLTADARAVWRQTNGFLPSDFVCIFSGGEWARKGLDLAIQAVAAIQDRRLKLFVAGDDPDRSRYIALTHELECSERVIFGGFRKDIATALGASDLFLFPSWYEAFSLATIEAAVLRIADCGHKD